MASGGGQSFGGWGNSYGGQSSLGGFRPQFYNQQAFGGKIGYEPSPQPTQGGPAWPTGGIPQMPQAPKAPSNPWMPAGVGNPLYSGPRASVDNNWYERGQGGRPMQQPPMINDPNWYERGQGMPPTNGNGVAFGGPLPTAINRMAPPMQEAPQQAPQPAQRQAPAGYYFDQSGRMLAGMDPAQFNKGAPTNIYDGSQSGQFGGSGYVPGSGWQQMLDIYAQQRNAAMGQAAPFGRYPDGTPMSDPNRNFRADYRLQNPAYAGGWPGYTPKG